MEPLTEREKKILYVVRTWQFEKGYSPSYQDIADFFVFSKGMAQMMLQKLVKKGYLEYSNHTRVRKKVLKFPKGTQFPWLDTEQFPNDIFDPRKPYQYEKELPSID